MEYIQCNLLNISLVSIRFYDLLFISDIYQNICKKEFRKSLYRHLPIDIADWKINVANHIELVQDKTYIDKFFLINFFYLKNKKETVTLKNFMIFNLAKKYSPSFMNAEYNEDNRNIYNSRHDDVRIEELMKKPGRVEVYRKSIDYKELTPFEIIKMKLIFFDYDKNTLERIYMTDREVLEKYKKVSSWCTNVDIDKILRENFPRQN